jgi:Family of unknown function (DUF5990)
MSRNRQAHRMDHELPIRVTVLRPPPGVTFAIQRGKDELLSPSKVGADSLVFELSIRVSQRKAGSATECAGPLSPGKAG